MQTRTLGDGGPEVSAVGLGTMSLVDDYYGPVSPADAERAVLGALDLGITLFDTADGYGHGESERRLGKALAGVRGRVVIASKLGLVPAPDDPDRVVDGRPSNVVRAIEGSLSRLGTDVIDLYQLHRVDPQVPVEETVGAMAELVAAGKVRYLGVSEVTADQLRRAHATYPVVSVQSEYSLFERTVEREVLGECDRLGVGLLAFGPLGKGLLSGSLQGVRDFASSDLRHRLPRFRGENLTRNQTVVEQLADIADSVRLKPGQLALAWLLARAPWVVPIPGTRNLKHLAENVAAAEANVGADVLAKVDEAIGPQTVAGQRYPEGWRLPRN